VSPPAEPAAAAGKGRGALSSEAAAAQRLDIAQAKIANRLLEPALSDLREIAADFPTTKVAAEAAFLETSVLEKLGRDDQAMAAHIEFNKRFPTDRRVPDSRLRLAELMGRSKRPDRDEAALVMFNEIARDYPATPQAFQALQHKIRIETSRRQLRQYDSVLGVEVPALLVTLRTVTEQFPNHPSTMIALNRLSEMYVDLNQYERAAEALAALATRFPNAAGDPWFRLGELYERRLKDPARARDAYARVPSTSPKYRDAQRKLKQ
jgi:TolA-binding protein